MTPKMAAQDALAQLESVTGYPVTVQDDPSLTVLATVKAANPSLPFTLIRLRPGNLDTREYHICYQCGFVLRQGSLPEGQRWDVIASPKGRMEVDRMIRKAAGNKLGQAGRTMLVENMLGGLIIQLRSVPIGLRIDKWINDCYPILTAQQRASTEQQLDDNLAVLSPQIKRMAPQAVYSASAGVNAAVAVYWAEEWDDNTKATAYKASGLTGIAAILLQRLRDIASDPEFDRALVDSWATELGIAGWYEYVAR